ncbi:MAG: O-antigen ligase family protein [Bacteroidota bacterium]|nr:O-antigen ligase family protein [Bacteroidota bacterium]
MKTNGCETLKEILLLLAVVSVVWSVFIFEAACLLLLFIALFLPENGAKLLRKESFGQNATIYLLIGVYVVLVVLSILFSLSPAVSMNAFRKLWHILLFFVGGLCVLPRERILSLLKAFSVSASAAAFTIIPFEALVGKSVVKNIVTPHNATTLAYLFVCAVMVSAIFSLVRERKRSKFFWTTVMALNLAGVLLLHLRLPIVLSGAGIIALALLFSRQQNSGHLAVVAALLFFFLLPGITLSRIELTLSGYTESRFVIWDTALTLLPHTPLFGYGPQTFDRLFPADARASLDDRRVSSWQNDFVTTALESGFPALAVLLLIFFLLFRTIASRYHAPPQRHIFFALAGILMAAALVNNVFEDPRLSGFFWLMSGLFYE